MFFDCCIPIRNVCVTRVDQSRGNALRALASTVRRGAENMVLYTRRTQRWR